jgi:2-(1,2-epoxy-1,2-dihydrophenyl)acetyl-CoA isomerase
MAEDVLFEKRGAVALLTLNRPQALNSFTRAMHKDLWAALDRIEQDPSIRACVLTGAGRGFCAGADLAEFDFEPGPDLVKRADPGPIINEAFNPTTRRLMKLRVPTVAAINGATAGAGVSIAMACDLAVAASGASFSLAFSRIGLIPDAGGTWFLIKKLGLARAMGAAMLSDKITAKDAKEWGMIWDVAPEGEDAVAAAMKLADRLAGMPTKALVATRHMLRQAASQDLDPQLDAERDMQSALGRTHDYIEGVMAFREKRAAQFKGE